MPLDKLLVLVTQDAQGCQRKICSEILTFGLNDALQMPMEGLVEDHAHLGVLRHQGGPRGLRAVVRPIICDELEPGLRYCHTRTK